MHGHVRQQDAWQGQDPPLYTDSMVARGREGGRARVYVHDRQCLASNSIVSRSFLQGQALRNRMPPSFHFNTWSDALLREGEIATPLGQEVVQGAPEEGPTGKRSLRIRHRMKTRDIGQWQGAFSWGGSASAH